MSHGRRHCERPLHTPIRNTTRDIDTTFASRPNRVGCVSNCKHEPDHRKQGNVSFVHNERKGSILLKQFQGKPYSTLERIKI
jgi:hypothetical protein